MALWGKTDTFLTATPKWIARKATIHTSGIDDEADTINMLSSGTGFCTGDQVVYTAGTGSVAGLVSGAWYNVRVVGAGLIELYVDQGLAFGGFTDPKEGLVNLLGVMPGTFTLQRTGAANVRDHISSGRTIVFCDSNEASTPESRAKGIKTAGWWAVRTYVDSDEVTRYKSECLVAMSHKQTAALAGDQEDEYTIDRVITVTSHPENESVVVGGVAVFTCAAEVTGTGGGLTYRWVYAPSSTIFQENPEYLDAEQYGIGTGANTPTLTTTVNWGPGDTDARFRCVISAAGAEDTLTDIAYLTVI